MQSFVSESEGKEKKKGYDAPSSYDTVIDLYEYDMISIVESVEIAHNCPES